MSWSWPELIRKATSPRRSEIDLERYGPPNRGLTWTRKQVNSRKHSFESRPESIRSKLKNRALSGFTLDLLWPSTLNSPTKSTNHDPSQASQKIDAQYAFIFAVTGIRLDLRTPLPSPALNASCEWYLAFLEFKIIQAWNTLLAPILEDVDQKATLPCDHDIGIAFQFLTAVASELKRKELALANIVDGVYNKFLLHETDDDRSKAHQLAFAALGWITVLYTPASYPKLNCLQLDDSCNDSLRTDINELRIPNHNLKTFWRLEENINDNAQLDHPLFQLLKRFGEILPQCPRNCNTPQISRDLFSAISGRYDDRIDISLVCFHAVNVIAGINIQWVDCMSLHLDFDSRAKTLKVFRFPSLCFLMHRNKGRSLLSQVFEDCAAASVGCETDYSNDYFKEALLSYRLLFGEESRSRNTFKSRIPQWQKDWKSTRDDSKPPEDPLLLILGSQSWESDEVRQIYDEIGAADPASYYSPSVDFVLFGKRLLDLQNYVRNHRPKSIWGFWVDKRDLQQWWTFWAVIIIGGATLGFALLQSVLQVLQVVLAQQQVNQGNLGSKDLRLLARELRDALKDDL